MKLTSSLIASILLVLAAPLAQAKDRIVEVDAPVRGLKDGRRISIGDVEEAILASCKAREFVCMVVSPGLISGRYQHNAYYLAEMSIPYSEQSFQIKYKHSVGMGYNAAKNKIKDDYNAWVKGLTVHIEARIDNALKRLKKSNAGA